MAAELVPPVEARELLPLPPVLVLLHVVAAVVRALVLGPELAERVQLLGHTLLRALPPPGSPRA